MTDYALSTNLFTFVQAEQGFFGWPDGTGEAEAIRKLQPGDMIILKFAQTPAWGGSDEAPTEQSAYCEAIGEDYEKRRAEYEATVTGGQSAVPFLLKVTAALEDDERFKGWPPTPRVATEKVPLDHPLSAAEFLRLRELPPEIAVQFKGAVAPGRHLQRVPPGTAEAVQRAAATTDREDFLRRYSLVEASSAEDAVEKLKTGGREPLPGDRVFLVGAGGMLGLHDVREDGQLSAAGAPIAKPAVELEELFKQAAVRSRPSDNFTPQRAIAAAKEMQELLAGPSMVIAVDDFSRFHDRYTLLASKVTQALEIANRLYEGPADGDDEDNEEEETGPEFDELAALQGLTVEAVEQKLPHYMVLPDSVLQEAVTALRAGKHLLLSGPPGTGKSTVADALCRAVVGNQFDVATGTADWTTFDTIGGYMPSKDGLKFEPGIVLRCLQRGWWLVIDELNRADIDKAFGPLFTLLAGSAEDPPNREVVLPFQIDEKNVTVRWAERRPEGTRDDFVLTPGWRLIGTLNVSDKATLFQLSFAFLRRFAIVEVPLPERGDYEKFFGDLCLAAKIPDAERIKIVSAGIALAFTDRQLGPAILRDIAEFIGKGLTETSTGEPTYDDPVEAFITAVRLFAVPQYEGATKAETDGVVKILLDVWPERPDGAWATLREALEAVALS